MVEDHILLNEYTFILNFHPMNVVYNSLHVKIKIYLGEITKLCQLVFF